MANYKLGAGTSVDLLNRKELSEELDKQTRDWYQERARGLTTTTFNSVQTVASSAVSIPSNSEPIIGPRPGFAWAVQRIAVQGLTTNDIIKVYKNIVTDVRFVDQMTFTKNAIYPGSKGLLLHGGDKLIFVGASLTATGDISVNGETIELPELDLYKIL